MATHITPPLPRDLLPPLFACLPTAYISPRPPPALLPLLSPILRQRVQYLSTTASTSDSWLPLLCWDAHQGTKLASIVESEVLEPHPVSGEIELPDVKEIRYRRLDSETLHSQIVLADVDLAPLYLWCEVESENETSGWRVAEVSPSGTGHWDDTWWQSISEATRDYEEKQVVVNDSIKETILSLHDRAHGTVEEEADDDDYWASYDKTPRKMPRIPKQQMSTNGGHDYRATTTDVDYYARYADTQPALDNDDPSEHHIVTGETTLRGDIVTSVFAGPRENPLSPTPITFAEHVLDYRQRVDSPMLEHPRPASSASSGSATVDRLETSASNQFMAEQAIHSHISTSFKSLFRLARNSGMERVEFVRRIQAELETLPMIDHED